MRFKLYYNSRLNNEVVENGFVVIVDNFKQFRKPEVVENTDESIREGIRHFYELDALDDRDLPFPKDWIDSMMDKLPKEDLSFKEVKEIE